MNWSSLTHRQVPAWGFFQVFCFGWGFNICMFKCLGLPWGSDSKESACNAGDPGSIPESVRFVWRSKWLPTPAFLPGKSHGQRSLVGYSPCGHKESDTTERLHSLMLSCYVGERGERFPHSRSFFKLKYSWFSTNFCCTAEWLSSTHKHFVLYSFPLCFNTGYGIYNSSLCYPAGLFVCLL